MATVEDTPTLKGPSLVIQGAIFAAMTVAALGIGWFAGSYLKRSEAPPSVPAAEANQGETAPAKNGDAGPNAGPLLVRLAPITTNLASPTTIWVRLDASLVLDTPQPPDVVEAVHQDLLAYLRTLKMHQVEGASGYQHLRADLKERAAIRSDGHVKDVLIRTLLFE
ncbi:MAG: flagellar basal body-associated FliL family protein [Mesorhizobium sp.]